MRPATRLVFRGRPRPRGRHAARRRTTRLPARVGLWDVGVRCPFLAELAEKLNRAQAAIVFTEVVAPPPAGADASPLHLDSVSPRAERIAETLGLHVVVAFCPHGPEANGSPTPSRPPGRSSAVVSARGLRSGDRPFEALLIWAALGTLLGALARESFRHDPSGCLFDAHDDPRRIAGGLASGHVHDACLGRLPRKLREPTRAIADTLVRYTRGCVRG